MRFFTQDPEAEFRKGLILTAVGGLVAIAVAVGVYLAVDGGVSGRIYASGIAGGVFAACFALAGCMTLRDAAALKRERSVLKARPRKPMEPRVHFQPKGPAGTVNPDLLPPFPARRMIAVTAMFAGLILPALYGVVALAGQGLLGAFAALFPLMVGGWLAFNVIELWRSKYWAWVAAVVQFSTGLFLTLYPLASSLVDGDTTSLAWSGAGAAHFALGLVALSSLKGPWLSNLEWKPGRDLLATADKPAVLAALRKISSERK